MYDPIANVCTDNIKLPIDGKCGSYKECSTIESVSMNAKWNEVPCGSGQHFDQESQKCIEAKDSTCSKCFSSFLSKTFFNFIFQKQIQFCVCQNWRRVMRASVRTGVNAKRLGQMSTAVYARLGSPAKIVNVIITIFKINLKKNIRIRITFFRAIFIQVIFSNILHIQIP